MLHGGGGDVGVTDGDGVGESDTETVGDGSGKTTMQSSLSFIFSRCSESEAQHNKRFYFCHIILLTFTLVQCVDFHSIFVC